jgi:hypothetical protein
MQSTDKEEKKDIDTKEVAIRAYCLGSKDLSEKFLDIIKRQNLGESDKQKLSTEVKSALESCLSKYSSKK